MANIVPFEAPKLTPQVESTISSMANWASSRSLPHGVTLDGVRDALAAMEPVVAGSSKEQFAGALRYLLAAGLAIAGKQPDMPDPMVIYFEELAKYPPPVLARAMRAVVRSHKWPNSPVLVAQIIEAAEADAEWQRLSKARARMQTAIWWDEFQRRDERRCAEHSARV